MRLTIAVVFSFAVGCGTDQEQEWVKDFNPPPAPDGFQRYITPIVRNLQPGANIEMCQWIAPPTDQAHDLIDLQGYQSSTGHHVVVYATTQTQYEVGESHECTEEDMVSFSFIGGVGGEGTATNAARLPEGIYFRLPTGRALLVNTHWLNATDEAVDGQAVIDVKFEPKSDQRVAADLFANNGDTFQIKPGGTTAHDTNCTVKEEVKLAMVTNHMHENGAAIFTEVIRATGGSEMVRNDPQWLQEWQFDPQYTKFTREAPMLLHPGDKVHTHCEWNNTTSNAITFPDEMCVGIGFYFPGDGMITCENGYWAHGG